MKIWARYATLAQSDSTQCEVDREATLCYNTHLDTKEHGMGHWEFGEFRIGRLFHCNGNDYIKQSTRTARMLSNGRVFYFGQREIIHAIAW